MRSLEDEVKVGPIRKLCPEAQDSLELVEAELTDHNSWIKATQCIKYRFNWWLVYILSNGRNWGFPKYGFVLFKFQLV